MVTLTLYAKAVDPRIGSFEKAMVEIHRVTIYSKVVCQTVQQKKGVFKNMKYF